ncbi:Hypothetical predicted protein [Marmota monax]|uniref:Uncharacterized protein n=1 Tax=Marmota monax TaxID=9995 RepID=A0A5E4B160_MARMO|nr:hypothetical protein GHT09_007922 [Marmota monax]VTJ62519.1 Hypothetical predicted protein [Marmota monax]
MVSHLWVLLMKPAHTHLLHLLPASRYSEQHGVQVKHLVSRAEAAPTTAVWACVYDVRPADGDREPARPSVRGAVRTQMLQAFPDRSPQKVECVRAPVIQLKAHLQRPVLDKEAPETDSCTKPSDSAFSLCSSAAMMLEEGHSICWKPSRARHKGALHTVSFSSHKPL